MCEPRPATQSLYEQFVYYSQSYSLRSFVCRVGSLRSLWDGLLAALVVGFACAPVRLFVDRRKADGEVDA